MPYIPAWECAWHECTNMVPEGNANRTCSIECRGKYMSDRQSERHLHGEAMDVARRIINNQYSHWATGDCENWMGSLSNKGYPTIRIAGKTHLVRRVAWILWMTKGQPIPKGLEIVETCGNFQCIFYEHLMEVTPSERARFASEMGSLPFKRNDIGPEQVKELRRRRMEGESRDNLATEIGMTPTGLGYILSGNRAGDPPLTSEEKQFFSRKRTPIRRALASEQVQEARRRNESGESAASLAREFKVHRSTIEDAIHKRGAYDLD